MLGFSEREIRAVVKGTLEKESHAAERLIQNFKVRDDVQSLCYLPLLCSIIISVYRESDEELPATLTESFENFILPTVRRHLE